MKLQSSEYSFYTYLRTNKNEDWKTCVNKLISQMKRKGFVYDSTEEDYRDENNCDLYNDGSLGAPMRFVKKVKKP